MRPQSSPVENTVGRSPISVEAKRGPTMALKRAMDVAGAIVLLLVTAPVLIVTGAAIRLDTNGVIIFRQERVGLCGREFTMLKFRSMVEGASDDAHRAQSLAELSGGGSLDGAVTYKDADDPRVTAVGRVIRRFSIDELPQLINVIRGDMSLVGPRPSLVWEVDEFSPNVDRRFAVRPGLTGMWQVSGRNQWSLPEMLEIDCDYADTVTTLGDINILLRTLPAALRGDGAA